MGSSLHADVIDLLFQHCLPLDWNHYNWHTQYRHTIASKCTDILWQCSNRAFRICNPIYCEHVEATCRTFTDRVHGVKGGGETSLEWPRNKDWFDREDYLICFTELLLERAERYAPWDGLLTKLGTFFTTEIPCSHHCMYLCTDEQPCPLLC